MPIAKVQLPDGRIARFEVADGTTPEQVTAFAQQQFKGGQPKPETSIMDDIKQGAGDLVAGAVRGAGSIGATILAPVDALTRKLNGGKPVELGVPFTDISVPVLGNERRNAMDQGLQSLGANTDSLLFKGGKIGAEIAGTSGIGGALAKPVAALATAVPSVARFASPLASALETGGFKLGQTVNSAPVNALTRIVGGAATGGAAAGLVNPEDAKLGAEIGGVLPIGAAVLGKVAQKTGAALRGGEVSPEVAALADRAKQLGIDIPADRIVNSKPLNALAASLDYVPFSGRASTEAGMQSQLNRALSRTFGQDSDNVTGALRNASSALGAKFDDVLKNNAVKIDNQFLDDLAAHEQRIMSELPFNTNPHSHIPASGNILKKQIDLILEKGSTGAIDGQTAYNLKRTLDRMGKANTPEAFYAREIKDSLMDALNRSLGSNEAAAFATTRQQYGNMRALEKLAQNGAEGDVSVGRLANLKNINNPDLQELADIAAQFLKSREGMHGAAQRAVVGAAGAGLAGLPTLAGVVAGGRATNMLLNSDMARNAVLGSGNPALENALSRFLPLTYRAAPVLSAQ